MGEATSSRGLASLKQKMQTDSWGGVMRPLSHLLAALSFESSGEIRLKTLTL